MGLFKEIATPLSARGIPTVPLRPKTKIAFMPGWETAATADLAQIDAWDQQYPDANCASVARAEAGGVWFFEFDAPEVGQRVLAETGQKLSDTFKVRSSPGKGHIYFRQSPASMAMGNIAQGFVKNLDWSARVHNQYVVSPGSIHPKTGLPYEIRSTAEIIEAPDWFVSWCISQKEDKKKFLEEFTKGEGPIPEHSRNDVLASIGGGFRNSGLEYPEILAALTRINDQRCVPPLPDFEVETIAASMSRYKKGDPLSKIVLVDGRVAGSAPQVSTPPSTVAVAEPESAVILPHIPYPTFPYWIMNQTSIYEGLIKPFCDANTRYPEYMFMPAMTLLLNYVGTKVQVAEKELNPSIFMVSIGRAGRVIKSSCVKDVMKYFEYMGCLAHRESALNNANGKAVVFTAASPEGFGKEMNRLNCKNGILFYDELKTLTDKASIENSDLSSKLLTMYESDPLQNLVKNPKDCYSILPGTYCASLIACTTDKKFKTYWSKLAGADTGLNDRFFFLYQPEVLKDVEPFRMVYTQEASARTRQLIDKAIQQKVYKITNLSPFRKFLKDNNNNNRAEIRAEKFALYFAIDLGLDEIDEECIERAIALADYEVQVKKFLAVYEANNKEAALQHEVRSVLIQARGRMDKRELERHIHPERHGTTMWNMVYKGLLGAGWIREEGTGVKGNPVIVTLLRVPEEDDE